MDRWFVLRNGIVLCKLGTAAWSVLWHSGRKGRFSDGLLYSAGSDPWFVFKEKCGWNIWLGMVITIVGLYLLCMTAGSLSFQNSDLFVLLCAFLFAIHILVIDHFSPLVDGVRMSCIQFLVAGVLSAFPMFFSEMGHSAAGIAAWLPQLQSWDAWVAILYAGVMSSGVAYTLQIIAQNGLNPTLASMIMSLESVFSVLAGWVILGEVLTARQLLGCLLIFIAIIFAQIPVGEKKEA